MKIKIASMFQRADLGRVMAMRDLIQVDSTAARLLDRRESDWAKKRDMALTAREYGKKLRKDKQKSFRLAIGRVR